MACVTGNILLIHVLEIVQELLLELGGFQLLDLIIPELKNHVIPYKFKCSHWWKIHFKKKILYKI